MVFRASVAQGIEHRSPKAGVGRSNRPGGTRRFGRSGGVTTWPAYLWEWVQETPVKRLLSAIPFVILGTIKPSLMQEEVPVRKAMVICVLVLAFCVALPLLGAGLRNHRIVRRILGLGMLVACGYGILTLTILGRNVHSAPMAKLELLWSYRASLAFAEEGLSVTNTRLLSEIMLNVLLFVPLGACLPFFVPELLCSRQPVRDMLIVLVIACSCSLAVELVQWLLRVGLFEFDDVLNNTLGTLLGFGMYRVITWAVTKQRD